MRDGTLTRKKLERCALDLFVKKGIAATTIKDIAQQAGVAEGTLYRHYESKEELAHGLFVNAYEAMAQKAFDITSADESLAEKVRNLVKFFCEKYDEDSVLFHYLLLTQHTQLKTIVYGENNAHDILMKLFETGIENKDIPAGDPHSYAAIMFGIVLQAAICRVYGRINRLMIDDAEQLTTAILNALQIKQ